MKSVRRSWFWLMPVAVCALAGAALAADAKSAPAKKEPRPGAAPLADDLLTDGTTSDLDDQLLDGAGPAKAPPGKPPASGPPKATPPAKKPAEGPPPAATDDEDVDPLTRISRQMRTLERRLETLRKEDAAQTRELQEQIVAELTQLIKQLEERQSSQQSSNSATPPPPGAAERKSVRQPGAGPGRGAGEEKRAARESTERAGKSEKVPPSAEELRGLMKDVWGQLPAHQREQMLQSPPEQFLPKYELLLEKYYRRLAEQERHKP
jgi:TolA-binding protein